MHGQLGTSGELTFPACAMSLEEPSSFRKEAEARAADDEEEGHAAPEMARDPAAGRPFRSGSSATDLSSNTSSINFRKSRQDRIGGGDGGFWCGVLMCMHLPGRLSRRRSMQQQPSMSLSEADTRASTAGAAGAGGGGGRASTVSRAASMERFKYRHSSSSSAGGIVFERADVKEEQEDQGEEVSAYFDLPLELLRISSVDTESPVTAAFLFDGNRGRGAMKVVPEMQDLDFSFPAPPPDFSSPSSRS